MAAVVLDKHNVFDTDDPRESGWFYRLANRLHVVTRDEVILKQLLLEPGDAFDARLADESGRILRRNAYFFDATLTPVENADGSVDLEVMTKDVWTLSPQLSFSRAGGENETLFGLEEMNLLGKGQRLLVARKDGVDRESTEFAFGDDHIGSTWIGAAVRIQDNSDGHKHEATLRKPFHSLESRFSAGMTFADIDEREARYFLGEEAAEYQRRHRLLTAFAGWSSGLDNGWVRRYTAGIVDDENRFGDAVDPSLPSLIPADRHLVYPFIGIEVFEDRFETARNHDQIGKTEDFFLGLRATARVGWADTGFGADRDALVFDAFVSRGFGSLADTALLVTAAASGRVESGSTANRRIDASARFYRKLSDKRLFFMTLEGVAGRKLDLEELVELGGDTGLRGYPLRYQTGHSKLLFTIEQRYYTDWYPFRLFRVGGAMFADVGRSWGRNPLGDENQGWLRDVGIGLRFASTRSGARRVIHFDIAFPLDGDDSIDSVQILLESKRSF